MKPTATTLATLCLLIPAMGLAEDLAHLKQYQYGADQTYLLAAERQVEQSMGDPARRAEIARRLFAVMSDSEATPAARQHAAILLRMCGTEVEVPGLAAMLGQEPLGEFARETLERISAQAAGKAIREALGRLDGDALVGVIHSAANRRDREAVSPLIQCSGSSDPKVAAAATHALGRIGGANAAARLASLLDHTPDAAEAYLACGTPAIQDGDRKLAESIFAMLSNAKYPAAIRRAALTGQLTLAKDPAPLLDRWIVSDDTAVVRVATRNLAMLPPQKLLALCQGKPLAKAIVPAEILASRGQNGAMPILQEAARQNDDPVLASRGIMAMSPVADGECATFLIALLGADTRRADAAVYALSAMSCPLVDTAVIAAYKTSRGQQRGKLTEVLIARRIITAIPMLLELAGTENDPSLAAAVSHALIALGDDKTLPRLVDVLLTAREDGRREKIEAIYLKIAAKQQGAVEPILVAMKDDVSTARLLPLAGCLGGEPARKKIERSLASEKQQVRAAALRGLCNWPDASVADRLAALAKQDTDQSVRITALRGYIRVAGAKSDRFTPKSLEMLQWAFQAAERREERILAVHRACNLRDVQTLRWLVKLLENEVVAPEACRSIVELAHHRDLRNPNREEFAQALKTVLVVSKDATMIERAKGYLEGI